VWFTRILLGVLTISFIVVCVATLIRGCNDEPVKFLWGLYENKNTDTITVTKDNTIIIHDTMPVKIEEKSKLSPKYLHDNTDVKSFNQNGGQTTRDIINN